MTLFSATGSSANFSFCFLVSVLFLIQKSTKLLLSSEIGVQHINSLEFLLGIISFYSNDINVM